MHWKPVRTNYSMNFAYSDPCSTDVPIRQTIGKDCRQ